MNMCLIEITRGHERAPSTNGTMGLRYFSATPTIRSDMRGCAFRLR